MTGYCTFSIFKVSQDLQKCYTVGQKLKWLNTKVCIITNFVGTSTVLDILDSIYMSPKFSRRHLI